MKSLAILLTVHDRKEKTINCLQKVHEQLPIKDCEVDIFLTDDGCTDGTPMAIRDKFPNVNIIKGDGNLFWNRGMHRAWETAAAAKDYDAYLWLNDDTILCSDAIETLFDCFIKNPDAIIVGTTKSGVDGKLTYGGIERGKIISPAHNGMKTCSQFNGNIVLVSRHAFRLVGNLDLAYSHSLGDIDYGLSAIKKNIEVLIAPKVLGVCENNPLPPKWQRSNISISERWKNLFSPLGYTNPPEYYHFKRKHWGHIHAILAMFSIALHFISPKLWRKLR